MTPVELVRRLLKADTRVAVTGATGWFGATALDLLDEAWGVHVAAERVTAYASSARQVRTSAGRVVEVRPLEELAQASRAPTVLLHFAFLTRNRAAEFGTEAYAAANLRITAAVLEAVAVHRPGGVVVSSSGAVYGTSGRLATDLDVNPYGTLKHLDELAFRRACADVGATCVVPRVFSVGGAHMTKPELYALGSMIGMARSGGPIQVRATGSVIRSFVGVDEIVALSLWAAMTGRDAVFDTGGEPIEVGDLAGVVAAAHGLGAESVERRFDPAAWADRYVGDGAAMGALAATAGLDLRPLSVLVESTAAWLRLQDAGPVPV